MLKPEEGLTDPNFQPEPPYIKLYANAQGGSLNLSPKLDGAMNIERMPKDLVLSMCNAGNPAGIANSEKDNGATVYNLGTLKAASEPGYNVYITLENLDKVSRIGHIILSREQTKELVDELNKLL